MVKTQSEYIWGLSFWVLEKKFWNSSLRLIDVILLVFIISHSALNIFKKQWSILEEINLVGSDMDQQKIDYGDSRIFYGLFLALKLKCCLSIVGNRFTKGSWNFEGLGGANRLLERKWLFKMIGR